ncbi:ubiquitin carboxyl-terminal hydrolase 11-like [Simochromis diagramma]|uniref:ubiquitin carboxyl-terminal hydrolase 11-like n=1 Tax=Simochromis diagramma TaxID=43689 RepID=UPI001A7EA9A8|nr:ubiquitin carboxyl-terminal hydrolase 11-like [Simochromis diagramma]
MTANSRCSAAESPGLETQRREIESLLRECELRAGESWYVVDRRWFDQWKEFVETGDQNSTSFPGQIDNAELFEDLDSYHLKDRLVEDEDFVLVPAEAWHKLLSWYGMVDDQPPLERNDSLLRGAKQQQQPELHEEARNGSEQRALWAEP